MKTSAVFCLLLTALCSFGSLVNQWLHFIHQYTHHITKKFHGEGPSWKVTSSSDSQEIPQMYWTKRFTTSARLIQSTPYHPQTYFNIIITCTPGSCKWFLSLRFHNQNRYAFLFSPMCHMPCPFHHSNNIWWGVLIIKLPIIQFCAASCYFFLFKSANPQPIFFPLCDKPSFHSCKTTGNITVLYIVFFKWDDKRRYTPNKI